MATIDPDFLAILRCPATGRPLREAAPAELEIVNGGVRRGGLQNRGGQPVAQQWEAALVSAAAGTGESLAYPIQQGIPILLSTEAVTLESTAAAPGNPGAPQK